MRETDPAHIRLRVLRQQMRLVAQEQEELRQRDEVLRVRFRELNAEAAAERKRLRNEIFSA